MKKPYILPLLFVSLSIPNAFGQKNCDTLVTTDGRHILIELVSTNSQGLLYTKCEETTDRQYFLGKEKIVEIRRKNLSPKQAPRRPGPISGQLPAVSNSLKKEPDPNRPKTILWLGLSLFNPFMFNQYISGKPSLQFGVETALKNTPTRIAAIVQPIFGNSQRYSNYASYQSSGPNGQIGVVLKSFSKGRLTGNVSNAYWGFDLFVGRQAYRYIRSSTSLSTTEIKNSWTTVMPRIGYQFTYEMLAFDIALPIGYQRNRHVQTGDQPTQHTELSLAVQPTVSLGVRF